MAAEARIGQIRKFFVYGRRETYDSSNESYQRPQYDSNVKTAIARVFGVYHVFLGFITCFLYKKGPVSGPKLGFMLEMPVQSPLRLFWGSSNQSKYPLMVSKSINDLIGVSYTCFSLRVSLQDARPGWRNPMFYFKYGSYL